MARFVTAHPEGEGDVLYVNCNVCGLTEPLGLGFSADDSLIDEATSLWAHECGDVSEFGLWEYGDSEVAARFYGLPKGYR